MRSCASNPRNARASNVSVSVSIGLAFYFADAKQKGRQAKKQVTLPCSVYLRLLPDTPRNPPAHAGLLFLQNAVQRFSFADNLTPEVFRASDARIDQ
jgi:hypothetical protein